MTVRRVLSAVALLALAGCHTTFGADTAESGASSAAAVATGSPGADDRYLRLAQDRLGGAGAADLLESREASCAAFDLSAERQTWDELLEALTGSGLSAEDAGYLLALQVRTGCPEHAALVP